MFTAIIMLCVAYTKDCDTYINARGPYQTEAECKAQVEAGIPIVVPLWAAEHPGAVVQISGFCKQDMEA